MDQNCIIDGHTNEKITRICFEQNCKKRLLCTECYLQNHINHRVLKIEEFFKEIQRLKSANCFNLIEIITDKSKQVKSFKEKLEIILSNLEMEFLEHQKYLSTSIKELLDFDFQYITEDFIELVIDVNGKNLLEQNYDKLMKLVTQQNEILTSILEQFQSQSQSIVLNQLLNQTIQSSKLIQFYQYEISKIDKIPRKFSLIRGSKLTKQIIKSEQQLYFGETNENNLEGRGIMINLQEQTIFDGIWKNNFLLWGKRIEILNGRIRGSIGYFDEYMKNFGECVVLFDNQDYYQGELVAGLFQGYGVLKQQNKEIYEGHFQNDLYHGQGKLILQNSEQYVGNFWEGKKHEQGQYFFKDGRKYKGQFQHNNISGEGEFRDEDDNLISCGNFMLGRIHGLGKVTLNSEQISQKIKSIHISVESQSGFGQYEGEFYSDKFEGYGIIELPTVFRYEGQFKNEQFDGLGILQIYQSQKIYIGKFKQSEFYYGYYQCPKYEYFGNFQKDMMHGIGILHNLIDQSCYAGQFKQNKKSGKGKQQLEDKSFYKGEFLDDLPNGKGQTIYNSKNQFIGSYKDGLEYNGVMTYADGNIYEGEFSGQNKQGQGILYLKNGDKIEGVFQQDQVVSGKYYFSNGDIFEGKIQDAQTLDGTMFYTNKNQYQGKLVSLLKQGQGTFNYQQDNHLYEYKGEFLNDQKHGQNGLLEKYLLIDGQKQLIEVYRGQFDQDQLIGNAEIEIVGVLKYNGQVENLKMLGKGKIQYQNGIKYEGDVVDGKKHGEGTLYYFGQQGKQKYTGQFQNDMEQGKGTLQYVNGDSYVGQFKLGLKHGRGILIKTDTKYEGEFANDLRQGNGVLSKQGQIIYDGGWENDRYHGSGSLCDLQTKQIYVGNFFQGKEQGKGIIQNNMQIKIFEGCFELGKKSGIGISYFPNGGIEYEGEYKDGVKWGKGKLYYKDKGNITFYNGDFVDDKKDGSGEEYYQSGQMYKGGFSNNLRQGLGEYYFANRDYYKGQFKNGQMNDPQGIWYYSNGERSIGSFVDGLREGVHKYYKPDQDAPYAEKTFENDQEKCVIF